jgi:hypothetical protein
VQTIKLPVKQQRLQQNQKTVQILMLLQNLVQAETKAEDLRTEEADSQADGNFFSFICAL